MSCIFSVFVNFLDINTIRFIAAVMNIVRATYSARCAVVKN